VYQLVDIQVTKGDLGMLWFAGEGLPRVGKNLLVVVEEVPEQIILDVATEKRGFVVKLSTQRLESG
jgi:hypothetical protein